MRGRTGSGEAGTRHLAACDLAIVAEEISRPGRYRPVETDGAARAAAHLAELIC